jgi:hypothetical protein
MKNILCLSSGLMPQYKLDILRVMALPVGATIQFRYGKQLIHSDLHQPFDRNKCRGRQLLIGHVDGNAKRLLSDGSCPVTLCRYGTLEKSERSGSYFILQISLGPIVLSHDWQRTQTEIESIRPRKRDATTGGNEEHHPGLSGLWCFETTLTTMPERSLDSIGIWEAVVRQLWQSPDFEKLTFFYAFESLYAGPVSSPARQMMSNGQFELRADKEYELRLLHWHPEADSRAAVSSGTKMIVTVQSPQIRSITSPRLPIDSPYDVKAYRVRTGASTKEEFSSFVVKIEGDDGKPVNDQPEIFLPVRIQPSYLRVVFLITFLAILLSLQQLVPLLIKDEFDWATALATFTLAFLAASVAVFGLKKPLS